ncbi:hypothetical protein FRC15_002113 [Serendipita sp. 397]|nr:hypothetical protein FRC15_002113 [Serendipita sp. 397]
MTTQMNLTGLKPSSLETAKVIQVTYLGHKDSHREFLLHLQALTGRIQRAALQYSTTFSNGGTGAGGRFISAQAQAQSWSLPRDGRQAREATTLKIEFSTGSAANKAQSLLVANQHQRVLPLTIVVTSLERLSYFVLEEGDILLSLNFRGIGGQQQMNLDDFSGSDGVNRPSQYGYGNGRTVYSQPRYSSHSFDIGSPYGNDLAPFAPTPIPIASPPTASDHFPGPSFGSEDGCSSSGSLSSPRFSAGSHRRNGYGTTTITTRTTTTTTGSPSVDGYSDAELESVDGSKTTSRMIIPDVAIHLPSDGTDGLDEFDQLALSMANFGVATPIVERTNANVPWHRERTIVAPIQKETETDKTNVVSDATSYHHRQRPHANSPPQVLYSHVASNRNNSQSMSPPAPRHAATPLTTPMAMTNEMRLPRTSISSESSSGSSSGSDCHSTSNNSHNDSHHSRQSSSSSRTHRPRQDKRLYVVDPHMGPRPTDWMLSEETLKSRNARDAKFAQVVAMGLAKGRTKAQWAQARRPGKRDRDAAKQKLREMEEANERERLQALLEESRQ